MTLWGTTCRTCPRFQNCQCHARDPACLCPCSGKTVTVTLWGAAAEEAGAELEALTHPLVSLSSCRVTDYNGAAGPCCRLFTPLCSFLGSALIDPTTVPRALICTDSS